MIEWTREIVMLIVGVVLVVSPIAFALGWKYGATVRAVDGVFGVDQESPR